MAESTEKTLRKSSSIQEAIELSKKGKEFRDLESSINRDLSSPVKELHEVWDLLKQMDRDDLIEIREFQNPSICIRVVMMAVCILLNVKFKNPMKKLEDWWQPTKHILKDPNRFLKLIICFDKDLIADDVVENIQNLVKKDFFQPAIVGKESQACAILCRWVRAIHNYHLACVVASPKRDLLNVVEVELAEMHTRFSLTTSRTTITDFTEGTIFSETETEDHRETTEKFFEQ